MANPNHVLAYKRKLWIPGSIPRPGNQNGPVDAKTITYTSSDVTKATVDADGVVTRILTQDTGSVTITINGYFLDSQNTDTLTHGDRPFTGSITFDLVPLAQLLPVVPVELKFFSLAH